MTIAPDIASRLKETAGAGGFAEESAGIAPHLKEWRGKYHGKSSLLLKPADTQAISRILAICHETGTAIVPQGGNTGLVGGQIPFHGEVLLSLQRMDRTRHVDAEGLSIVAEAGSVLANVQHAADEVDRYFPLSLASEGSCTIGGNLSTNAGGVNVLRYGNARDLVLGLEVVLADGRVLDMLRTLRKDNTGYDLKQLFIGAEGTLGVITAAALKLFAKPRHITTCFIAVPSPTAAIALLSRFQEATGGLVSGFELIPRIGIEFVLAHIPGTSDPMRATSPWYILAEIASGADPGLDDVAETILARALKDSLITDAVVAASEAQRAQLWRLRESVSEAQKPEGGSIKHDVSVPIARVPEFIEVASRAVTALIPGARPVPFGHLGDGNIHFNISVPKGGDSAKFLARWEEIAAVVHQIVAEYGGSISAEHGIGVMKRAELARYKSVNEIETMRSLKRMFDPKNILNPGKLLPD